MIKYAVALATLGTLRLLACHGCNDATIAGPPPTSATGATSAASPASSASASPTGDTVIHDGDDGKSFDIARGGTVTFKLPSNAGTGYVWVPMQVDSTILTQQGDRTSEISSDTPGAPKLDVYRFTAGSAGSTVVGMSLKRPFGSAPPARAIHVTVNVH
jgi:predicted secreted protein